MHPARQVPYHELLAELEKREIAGLVRSNTLGSLRLFVYTESCVYENAWDEYTTIARGLILDTENECVVATPFPKFFNYGQISTSIPDLPFETFEKVDGSLIIVFYHDGEWKTATKGSLNSSQAQWAKKRIKNKYMTPGHTYLFEGIYPENKIVVDYGGLEFLVLLGAYDIEGRELSYDEIGFEASKYGFELVPRHHYNHLSELLAEAPKLPKDREGFVVRFENGFRLKIKGDEYCRIHRMISHCTPLAIWELMKDGSEEEIWNYRKELPDEFHHDFDVITMKLGDKLNDIIDRVTVICTNLESKTDKEVGLMLNDMPTDIRKFIFPYRKFGNLLKGKAKEGLFRSIRPTGNRLDGYMPSSSLYRVLDETS